MKNFKISSISKNGKYGETFMAWGGANNGKLIFEKKSIF